MAVRAVLAWNSGIRTVSSALAPLVNDSMLVVLLTMGRGIVSVISVPQAFNEDSLFVDLHGIFGQSLYLKCEGFNFAGSVKLKAAAEMVEAAERDGVLTPDSVLIESSSGNLGVALSHSIQRAMRLNM